MGKCNIANIVAIIIEPNGEKLELRAQAGELVKTYTTQKSEGY